MTAPPTDEAAFSDEDRAKMAGMAFAQPGVLLAIDPARVLAVCRDLDAAREAKAFKDGARAMFDFVQIASANNYSFNAAEDARREDVNVLARSMIEDAFECVSPDKMAEWRKCNELMDERDLALDRATKAEVSAAAWKDSARIVAHERDAALGALAECRDEIARMKTPPITIFTGEP